jgi:hypothetical protein
MPSPGLIRSDEADIRLSIEGKPYFDSWQTYEGGAKTATSAATRGGGMGRQRKAGGPAERGDATVTIDEDDVTIGYFNELENYIGWGEATVSIQKLNPNRTAIPDAHFTRQGVVIDVHMGNHDARTNTPEVNQITVVIALHEVP